MSETPWGEVSPQNGVWDAEYGRTDDPANASFRFRILRYVDGIGVEARVRDDRIVTDNCTPGAIAVHDDIFGKNACPSWDDDNLECFFDGDNVKSKNKRQTGVYSGGGEYALVANGAAQSDFSCCPNSFGQKWQGAAQIAKHPQGGIIKQEASIHISNLNVVDPKTGKPTRIGRKLNEEGKLVRYSKKSGEEIK